MSLAEVTLSLAIAGILTGLATPAARRGIDSLNARAARESVFAAATRTRAAALAQGGATLTLDARLRLAIITTARGHLVAQIDLSHHHVDVLTDASSSTVALSYDGRGIGRMASRTVRFQRGDAIAGITFSSYGRARRW